MIYHSIRTTLIFMQRLKLAFINTQRNTHANNSLLNIVATWELHQSGRNVGASFGTPSIGSSFSKRKEGCDGYGTGDIEKKKFLKAFYFGLAFASVKFTNRF